MNLAIFSLATAGILVDAPEAQKLWTEGATVLDARGRVDFVRGHIPGAQRLDWRVGTIGGITSGKVGDPQVAAAAFAAAGVRSSTTVLVVGAWDAGWGEEGRLAWDLLYLGHPKVHVLRGGMATWTGPTDYLPRSPSPGDFSANPRPEFRGSARDPGGRLLVDVREPDEFAGAQHYGEARGGHVPGALSLPWKQFLRGIPTLEKGPVLLYCTGGVRSAMVWVILKDAGWDVVNDDGGWWDYTRG